MVLLIAVVAGGVVGALLRGSFRGLAELSLRTVALVWIALAIQMISYLPGLRHWLERNAPHAAVLVSYALIASWLAINVAARRRVTLRAALLAVALGWLLNFAVIAANGAAMPVSSSALSAAGLESRGRQLEIANGSFYKHVRAGRDTTLRALGDVIPVRPLRTVISAGDILLVLGVAGAVALAMREPARAAAGGSAP